MRHRHLDRLPPRDALLLPLLGALTILMLTGGAELVVRQAYPEEQVDVCLLHDPALGVRYKPACTAKLKLPESRWSVNQYNECGFRTRESCGPIDDGHMRIALLGSSIALGLYVPYDRSIGAALSRDLTAACKRPVEVQNLASEYEFWDVLRRRFALATALHPDAIVVVAGPTDIQTPDPMLSARENVLPKVELLTRLRNLFADSRLRVLAQHFLYRNQDFYLSLYRNSVAKTQYMRFPLAPALATHVSAYGDLLARIQDPKAAKPIPVLLAYVPQRAQVGLAARITTALDPYALNRALARVSSQHKVAFVDTTEAFLSDRRQMDLFLRSDGHLNDAGDGVVAHDIASGIVRNVPAFQACVEPGNTPTAQAESR